MLQKLRRRLTLINIAISGAALLAMTLFPLYLIDRQISRQPIAELERFSRQIFMQVNDSSTVRAPATYAFYVGSTDPEIKPLYSTRDEPAQKALDEAKRHVLEALERDQSYPAAGYPMPGDMVFIRVITSDALPIVKTDTSYRITAYIASYEPSMMVIVAQNMREEIAQKTRLRVTLFLMAGLGLTLVGLGSLLLSGKLVRPVEQSIRRQREFVAAASHELRTPIAAIQANASVLSDAPLGDFAGYLESIHRESERMAGLVRDLLFLARSDAGEMPTLRQPVEIGDAVRETVAAFAPVAQRAGVQIHTDAQDGLIVSDASRIQQLLVILLDNAIKAVSSTNADWTQYADPQTPRPDAAPPVQSDPRPGDAAPDPSEPAPRLGTVWVRERTRGNAAWIEVADDGPGIADADKARIFDRFYRVDVQRGRKYGGYGLGLSVALEIVRALGAQIAVRDRQPRGTRFLVTLPEARSGPVQRHLPGAHRHGPADPKSEGYVQT